MLIGISGAAGSGKDTTADFLVADHLFVKVALADEIKRIAMRLYGFTRQQLWGPSSERNKPDLRYPVGVHLPCGCIATSVGEGPYGGIFVRELYLLCQNEHKTNDWYRGAILPYDDPLPVAYLTPRHVLQILGTEIGRRCYRNTWVDLTFRTYEVLISDPKYTYDCVEGLIPRKREGQFVEGSIQNEFDRYAGVVIPDVQWPSGNEGIEIRRRGGVLLRTCRGEGLQGPTALHESELASRTIPNSFFDYVATNEEWTLEQLRSFVNETVQDILNRRQK